MKQCTKCNKMFKRMDLRKFYENIICDDCYIDEIVPRMPKAHYDNEAEFMNRLKESYTVRQQQFH